MSLPWPCGSASSASRWFGRFGIGWLGAGWLRGVGRFAIVGLLAQQGLIVGGGTRRCRISAREPIQVGSMVVGQRIQWCLGLAPCRQDSLDRRQGEGAVLHGPLQRREDILTRIGGHQRQHAFRLVLAVAGLASRPSRKLRAGRAELGKPLVQLFGSTLCIAGRLVVLSSGCALPRSPRGKSG